MFVKTQTKWALIRVNYVVLVFGTKKKCFKPYYRKVSNYRKSVALMKNVHVSWLISLILMKLKLNVSISSVNVLVKKNIQKVFYQCHKEKKKNMIFFPFLETGPKSRFLRRSPISSFSAKLFVNLRDCPWS